MKPPKGRYPVYALAFFSFYFALGMFSSLLPIYLGGIGKSGAELSLIISASSLFSIVLSPLGGYLSDSLGKPKRVASAFLLLAAVLGVVFSLSRQTWLLFLLNGLVIAAINCAMPVYERAASGARYRYGVIRVWGAVGFAAAAQTAGLVYEWTGGLAIYIIFSAASVISALSLHAMGDGEVSGRGQERQKILLPWRSRDLWLFLILALVFAGSTGVSSTYLPVLFTQMGRTVFETGTLLFFATLMEVPIILFSNRFMDRFSGKKLLIVNFTIVALQFAVYSFAESSVAIIAAAVLFKSLSTMLFIMVTLKVVVTIVPENTVTTALSIAGTFKYIGAVLFQNIGGRLVDAAGIPALYRVLTITAVIGILLSACLRIHNREGIFTAQSAANIPTKEV